MKKFQKELGYFIPDNIIEDTHTYILGIDNFLPISLLLSLLSSYEKSPERFLNLFISSHQIETKHIDFKKILCKKMKESIIEKFNAEYIGTSIVGMKGKPDLTPDYKEVELWNYVSMWTKMLNSATPLFETKTEGMALCCSIDDLRFLNRSEFNLPYEFLMKALISIINEVSMIMKKRNFELSKDGYLVKLNGFKHLQIDDYYGNF